MATSRPRPQVMRLSEAAARRIRDVIGKADRPIAGVRVGVKNGGCAGMSYTMEYAETVNPLDEVVEDRGVRLLIDPEGGAVPARHRDGLQGRQALRRDSSSTTPTRPRPAAAANSSPSRRPRRRGIRRSRADFGFIFFRHSGAAKGGTRNPVSCAEGWISGSRCARPGMTLRFCHPKTKWPGKLGRSPAVYGMRHTHRGHETGALAVGDQLVVRHDHRSVVGRARMGPPRLRGPS